MIIKRRKIVWWGWVLNLFLVSLFLIQASKNEGFRYPDDTNYHDLSSSRNECIKLIENSQLDEALGIIQELELRYSTLHLLPDLPSFYSLKGAILMDLNLYYGALQIFKEGILLYPDDIRSCDHVITIENSLYYPDLDIYFHCIEKLEKLLKIPFLFYHQFTIDWESIEVKQQKEYEIIQNCISSSSISDCDLLNININMLSDSLIKPYLESKLDHSMKLLKTKNTPSQLSSNHLLSNSLTTNKIRIGVLMDSLASTPVLTLSHKIFEEIASQYGHRIELYLFIFFNLDIPKYSWQETFSKSFHYVQYLPLKSSLELAQEIASQQLHILLDTTSLAYSLPILSHRPAPIQILHMGDVWTSGANFYDYFVSDPIALPVELAEKSFSENLLYFNQMYLPSSHSIFHLKVRVNPQGYEKAKFIRNYLEPIDPLLITDKHFEGYFEKAVLLGVFNNFQKFDPLALSVWMNILRAVPNANLIFSPFEKIHSFSYQSNITHKKDISSREKLVLESNFHGILCEKRMATLKFIPKEEDHVLVKSAMDLFLDSFVKSGHTTAIDALFASLPVITLGGQTILSKRFSESLNHYFSDFGKQSSETIDSYENEYFRDLGTVYSVKEYEDFVIWLLREAKGQRIFQHWKKFIKFHRSQSIVFDIKHYAKAFVALMEKTIDIKQMTMSKNSGSKYHILPTRN